MKQPEVQGTNPERASGSLERMVSRRCKSHEEWRARMNACFAYMLHGFSLDELEEMVKRRKSANEKAQRPSPKEDAERKGNDGTT